MNRFLKVFIFLVCGFCLITSFSQFQKTAVSKIQWSDWKWFEHEKDDLSVSFRVYSKNECKELLSKDLVSRGYQPIQIDIVNSTSAEYEITPADISLPSEKPSKMALKVMKSAVPRSIVLKIAGLFFWPVNIVGAIDSLNSLSAFDDMNSDWKAMSVKPNEKVPAFSTLHRVIFVPEDFLKDKFTIQLKNVKSGEYSSFESTASLEHLVQMQNGAINHGVVNSETPQIVPETNTAVLETSELQGEEGAGQEAPNNEPKVSKSDDSLTPTSASMDSASDLKDHVNIKTSSKLSQEPIVSDQDEDTAPQKQPEIEIKQVNLILEENQEEQVQKGNEQVAVVAAITPIESQQMGLIGFAPLSIVKVYKSIAQFGEI